VWWWRLGPKLVLGPGIMDASGISWFDRKHNKHFKYKPIKCYLHWLYLVAAACFCASRAIFSRLIKHSHFLQESDVFANIVWDTHEFMLSYHLSVLCSIKMGTLNFRKACMHAALIWTIIAKMDTKISLLHTDELFLQYLTNAEYLINGLSVTSKPTLMIPNNIIYVRT
jgi:hypothetical protein